MASNIKNQEPISCNSKTPTEMAYEIYQETKVDYYYNHKGKFSHLTAQLPKNEFIKLYSSLTSATMFIHGFWLQFILDKKTKKILCRDTHMEIPFEVGIDSFGKTTIKFYRAGKCVFRSVLKNIPAGSFLMSEAVIYKIALAAIRFLEKYFNPIPHLGRRRFPVILILPIVESTEFNRNFVLLQ